MVEKRFVGGRLRSCALSSPVRTRRRGEEDFGGEDGLGGRGDASAIIGFLICSVSWNCEEVMWRVDVVAGKSSR
jgi:hypothetical protein